MTLLLGFAAVNTGNNLLYLLVSALLGFMAVSGLLGRANLAGLEIGYDLPDEIYDGIETLVGLRLRNHKRFLPAFLIQVALEETRGTFLLVEARGERTLRVPLTLNGRGRRILGGLRVRSRFPINFFVRSLPVPGERTLTVFPAPMPCREDAGLPRGGQHGERALRRKGYEGELRKITDYRGGEPLKLIHWKLSARHGELKVKELSAASREPVVIDPEALPAADREARLRCAVYLVNRYLREGRPVGLRLGSDLRPPALTRSHKLRLLAALAEYGTD